MKHQIATAMILGVLSSLPAIASAKAPAGSTPQDNHQASNDKDKDKNKGDDKAKNKNKSKPKDNAKPPVSTK